MALPLPKVVPDVGPGGPLVTAMRGGNALAQDLLNTQIKGAEAQYAPWTNYSNAASKLAYSQFVGPQSIANILSNPATRGMFTPEQYRQLANAFSQQVGNPMAAMGSMPPPSPRGDGMLSRVINALTGVGSQQVQSGGMPSPGMQAMQPQQGGINAGYALDAQGRNMVASPQEVAQIASQGNNAFNQPTGAQPVNALPGVSPTYTRQSGQLMPDTYGGASPSAITSAGEEALKAKTQAEAKAITDQWKDRQDDIRNQVTGAQEMGRQLDKMSQARGELNKYEKGPALGSLPAISNAAQDMDTAAANLVAARLRAWQSSRITNMDIGFGQLLKPGRWMQEESFNNEVNYEKGLSNRLQEYPQFAEVAQMKGLTPAQADAIWARYANEKPFYDTKNKKVLWHNVDGWEDYLDQDSIRQTFSPSYRKKMQQYKQNMAGGNTDQDQKIMNSYNEPRNSHGSEMLSKNLDLPKFNNREEFQAWYKKQPKMVKDAVNLRLKGNK